MGKNASNLKTKKKRGIQISGTTPSPMESSISDALRRYFFVWENNKNFRNSIWLYRGKQEILHANFDRESYKTVEE